MLETKNDRRLFAEHHQDLLLRSVRNNFDAFRCWRTERIQQTARELWVALFGLRLLSDNGNIGVSANVLQTLERVYGPNCFPNQDMFKTFSNATLVDWINDMWPSGASIPVDALGMCYEQSLDRDLTCIKDELHWRSSSARGRQGAYFTPPELCDFLVSELIDKAIANPKTKSVADLRICDPAMGAGAFLLSALRYMKRVSMEEKINPIHLARCLAGADKDPDAALICAISLWLELNAPSVGVLRQLQKQLISGNALLWLSEQWLFENGHVNLSMIEHGTVLKDTYFPKQHDTEEPVMEAPVLWQHAFPDIFTRGGFSIVMGNPPYLSAMTGGVSKTLKSFYRLRYPKLSGRADLSAYFWQLAIEICQPGGHIGLVLPRPLLGADACRALREPATGFHPRVIYSPEHYSFFDDASIKIMCLVLGPSGPCRVSNGDSPTDDEWQRCDQFRASWGYAKYNWWSPFWLTVNSLKWPEINKFRIAEEGFIVRAGVGPTDFYALKLVDDPTAGVGPKLIVSGLIDPNRCDWGKKPARYKKQKFMHPCVEPTKDDSASLVQHISESKRPKLILANLVTKLECMLDETGDCLGATATYCIFDVNNDVFRLKWLCDILHAEQSTILFHMTLGANAMHSNLSIRSRFLKEFPIPEPPRGSA